MAISDKQDTSTVISLLPVPIDEDKPGLIPGKFLLPAVVDPMKDFNLLTVSRCKFPVYLDENRPALIVPAPSDTVAESICRDYKISMAHYETGVAEPGLFWARGNLTKNDVLVQLEQDLNEARKMQVEWFKRLVDSADDDWGKYHVRRLISSLQRKACQILKLDREWNMDKEVTENLKLTACKFCRADIHAESVVCRYCGGILNMARYKAEFVKSGTDLTTK